MKKNKNTFTFFPEGATLEKIEKFLKDDPVGEAITKAESAIKVKSDEVKENEEAKKSEGVRNSERNPTATEEVTATVHHD